MNKSHCLKVSMLLQEIHLFAEHIYMVTCLYRVSCIVEPFTTESTVKNMPTTLSYHTGLLFVHYIIISWLAANTLSLVYCVPL